MRHDGHPLELLLRGARHAPEGASSFVREVGACHLAVKATEVSRQIRRIICVIFCPFGDNLCELVHDLEDAAGLWISFCTELHDRYGIGDGLRISICAIQRCELVHKNNEARSKEEVTGRGQQICALGTRGQYSHDERVPPRKVSCLPGSLQEVDCVV